MIFKATLSKAAWWP